VLGRVAKGGGGALGRVAKGGGGALGRVAKAVPVKRK
jgi:hypothetical protein